MIDYSYSNSAINGELYIGGLVGYNYGIIPKESLRDACTYGEIKMKFICFDNCQKKPPAI